MALSSKGPNLGPVNWAEIIGLAPDLLDILMSQFGQRQSENIRPPQISPLPMFRPGSYRQSKEGRFATQRVQMPGVR